LRKLSLWARFGQTIYIDRSEIVSGLDLVKGNKKAKLKMQLMYDF
jgi:hypothetical protein